MFQDSMKVNDQSNNVTLHIFQVPVDIASNMNCSSVHVGVTACE